MPYIETIVTPQALHIAVWQLTEELSQLKALWGDVAMPENFAKSTSDKRRREILATALLIRHYWGCDVPVRHSDNGAPLIDQGYISISHTASYVVAAFHPTRRIGVDIEALGARAPRVSKRFMSSSEIVALPDETETLANGISARNVTIHLAWSVKEAVYKIHPEAVEFREDIILDRFESMSNGCVEVALPGINLRTTAYYTLYNDCSLAWVVE